LDPLLPSRECIDEAVDECDISGIQEKRPMKFKGQRAINWDRAHATHMMATLIEELRKGAAWTPAMEFKLQRAIN
jgi:hypothetical protein